MILIFFILRSSHSFLVWCLLFLQNFSIIYYFFHPLEALWSFPKLLLFLCSDYLLNVFVTHHTFHFCPFWFSFLIFSPILSCALLTWLSHDIVSLSSLNILTMVSLKSFSEDIQSCLRLIKTYLLISLSKFGGFLSAPLGLQCSWYAEGESCS